MLSGDSKGAAFRLPLEGEALAPLTLFTYTYGRIWPGREISERGREAQLNFVEMSDEAWRNLIHPPDSDDLF